MSSTVVATLVTAALALGQSYAQETTLVEINRLSPRTIKVAGFVLQRGQEVKIKATGLNTSRHQALATNAWILNTQTRELVWEMKAVNTSRRDRTVREFEGALQLPAGTYEAYYAIFSGFDGGVHVNDLGKAITYLYDRIFEEDDHRHNGSDWQEEEWEAHRSEYDALGITIKGSGRMLDAAALQAAVEASKSGAVINLTGLWDDQYKHQGFTLEQPTELQIYAQGEARRDGDFDYGWIIDTKTRAKVWKFRFENSEPAGGAEKNRRCKDTITLPAGSYAAMFVTDDSHSYRRWNSPPPYDPEYWGLLIKTSAPAARAHVRLYEYEDLPSKSAFLELTRARNDESLSKGFTLKQPLDVRIYAMGEGRDGKMFDYGWIVDAQSHKKVWAMSLRDTEHAGGDNKNRIFDEVVHFDKGNYIVYYVTDGSHAYRDWNAAAPIAQERWGITLLAANENTVPSSIAAYEPEAEKNVLAQIVDVRDEQHRSVHFTLDKSGDVRVYALGEGSEGDMDDYGWIEDTATSKVVWEMSYRMTQHAGGAEKNRVFDDTVYLKAGEYVVHYRSDGSHSARDWNDDPPYDPTHWGITIYRVEK